MGDAPLTAVDVVTAGGSDARILPRVRALHSAAIVDGPAVTCACEPGDNLALHFALLAAAPGSVLVCAAGGQVDHGYFGELMARDALNRNVAGLIIDGSVRDTAQLLELRFPVFCLGRAMPSCRKEQAGSTHAPVVVDGVSIDPGDRIVADSDGVVVVPAASWDSVRARADALRRREAEIVAELNQGVRLAELLSLPATDQGGI